jgi:hypothetical protein
MKFNLSFSDTIYKPTILLPLKLVSPQIVYAVLNPDIPDRCCLR